MCIIAISKQTNAGKFIPARQSIGKVSSFCRLHCKLTNAKAQKIVF